MIEAIGLNKFYGAHHAVRGVSFYVEKGRTVGFLGGNGAGKSTTMRMLTGFICPSSGRALINGIDVNRDPLKARACLGYLPESTPLYRDMRVDEFLHYRARLKGIARSKRASAVDKSAESCWLTEVRGRIIGHLSKGYRQRVGLADCLLGDPQLLILDEPTVGLDPNQVRQTRGLIQEIGRDRTVFLSTHILHEVELVCEEVIIIHHGELAAQGRTDELCNRYDGVRTLRLQISGGIVEEVLPFLEQLQGVEEIVLDDSGAFGGSSRVFNLEVKGDPRREIAVLASQKNWLLEEMVLQPVKLEDIFSRLTVKQPAGMGKEVAGA